MTNKNHKNLVTAGSSTVAKTARAVNDFYATPPYMTKMLLRKLESIEPAVLNCDFFMEPCNGMAHISNELKQFNKNIYTYDITDYNVGTQNIMDYLELDKKPASGSMSIITNPPYSHGLEFLKKSFELMDGDDYYVFLGRIQFLEGKKRREFFNEHPPKYVFVFSERQNCWKDGIETNDSSAICYAWFVFKKGFKGDTKVKWL